jgi:monovalent cation/hydrogen antiporter
VGLLLQGSTLRMLIRATGLEGADDDGEAEARARVLAARAALERLDEAGDDEAAGRVRQMYESRLARSRAPLEEAGDEEREHAASYADLRSDLLKAERRAVMELHERGELPDDAMERIQRDLDLEEARLG